MLTFLTTLSFLLLVQILCLLFCRAFSYRTTSVLRIKKIEHEGDVKYIACRDDDNDQSVILLDGKYYLSAYSHGHNPAMFETPVDAATALMAVISDEDIMSLKVVQILNTSSLDAARKTFREWLYKAP